MSSVADELTWNALDDETKRIAREMLAQEIEAEVQGQRYYTHEQRVSEFLDEIDTLHNLIKVFLNAKGVERALAERALAEAIQ